MFQLRILVSIDETEPGQQGQQHPPALYFVLNGRCYLINHTLLQTIKMPDPPPANVLDGSSSSSSSSGSAPSVCFCWPSGVQMRFWLDPRTPPAVAAQTLVAAAHAMQHALRGEVMARHATVTEERQRRRAKRRRGDPLSAAAAAADAAPPPATGLFLPEPYHAYTHSFDSWVGFAEQAAAIFPAAPAAEDLCAAFLSRGPWPLPRGGGTNHGGAATAAAGAAGVVGTGQLRLLEASTADAANYTALARLFAGCALSSEEAAAIEKDFGRARTEREAALNQVLDQLYPQSRPRGRVDSGSESQSQQTLSQFDAEALLLSDEEAGVGAAAAVAADDGEERRRLVDRVVALHDELNTIHAHVALFRTLPRAVDPLT